ncbi:hypothetical protein D9619_013543 [Psilocybe cf. subviscida]|uniref:Uncharacterized protein n=1 Tax=Psilocybe cf. subviscida TaxID=2480587 RepID=A0A8H5F4H6_9AGAR|nr:hypothetical protein D9619_013543 [Psilocybe cf. subviscida]
MRPLRSLLPLLISSIRTTKTPHLRHTLGRQPDVLSASRLIHVVRAPLSSRHGALSVWSTLSSSPSCTAAFIRPIALSSSVLTRIVHRLVCEAIPSALRPDADLTNPPFVSDPYVV